MRTTILMVMMAGLGAGMADVASAQTRLSSHVTTVGEATAPAGWIQFCADNPGDCEVQDLPRQPAILDERRWRELQRVNRAVNAEIAPVTDLDHWGRVESWNYPLDGRGDCEDYVLEKRRRLLAAGWPRQALLVTVVRDKRGDGHAVLTVKTDKGEYILDNQERDVLPWTATGYRFHKRQSEEHPSRWVSLGGIDTQTYAAIR